MAGIVSRRLFQWSTMRRPDCAIIFTPLSKRLLASVSFRTDRLTVNLFNVENMLREIKDHDPEIEHGKESILRVRLDLTNNPEINQRSRLDVLPRLFMEDARWQMLLRGVSVWFEKTRQVSGPERGYTSFRIDADHYFISALLDSGYREFLDDESIPEMNRALMFLSVLASAANKLVDTDQDGDPHPVQHLSAGLARRIIDAIDLDREATRASGREHPFTHGFNLFSPASSGTTKITAQHVGYRCGWGFDDGIYKLVSVLLCRMNGVEVDASTDWVVPFVPDRADYHDLGIPPVKWVNNPSGQIPVDEATLVRISELDERQAQRLYEMVGWCLGGSGFRYSRLGHEDFATIHGMVLSMVLALIEARVDTAKELKRAIEKACFPAAAIPGVSIQYLDLINQLGAEADRGVYGDRVFSATLFWLLTRHGNHGAFEEVARFWGEKERDYDDLIHLSGLADRYLTETVSDPDSAIPFHWWLSLSNGVMDEV